MKRQYVLLVLEFQLLDVKSFTVKKVFSLYSEDHDVTGEKCIKRKHKVHISTTLDENIEYI